MHVFRNNSTISRVYEIDESLRMFFTKLFDYIECLQSSTTTLCVVALSTCAVCMFSLMYGYFDCFSTIVSLVCMFSYYRTYIACFRKMSAITLHVLPRKTLLCMFRIKWPCHFECLSTIMFTSSVGCVSVCVVCMFLCSSTTLRVIQLFSNHNKCYFTWPQNHRKITKIILRSTFPCNGRALSVRPIQANCSITTVW